MTSLRKELLHSLSQLEELKQRGLPVNGLALARGDSLIIPDKNPVQWLEHNFYIPEANNGPIVLHPYIKAALKEALRVDEAGNFIYSTIIWSDIKKSGKSSIAAGIALWFAYLLKWGSIKVIANDLEQAESRVAYYMRRAISLNPKMRQEIKTKNYNIFLPNQTVIKAIPIDPEGEAGGNDDMIIFSELWGAKGEKAQRMWTEATLPPNKFGRSFRWVETYAGYTGESLLLENLYEQTVVNGEQLQLPPEADHTGRLHSLEGLEVYSNPDARMFCLWNTKPRLPWQTKQYYQTEKAVIQNSQEYERIHENKWSASSKRFVEPAQWGACQITKEEINSLLDSDDAMICSIDAAVTNDNFAISLVSRNDDIAIIRQVRLWIPPGGRREINYAAPEYYLRKLVTPKGQPVLDDNDEPLENPETGEIETGLDLNIIEFAYDPFQLVDMSQRLRKSLSLNFVAFNQNADRSEADSMFQKLINGRRLRHFNNPELNLHVANSNTKITYAGGDGETGQATRVRLVKRTQQGKIDLAVASSMGVYRIFKYNV